MKIKKFYNAFIIFFACYCLSVSAATKVAIYQGSFNPLTIGHENIIQNLLNEYNDVYIVPDRSTGYKKLGPFNVRNAMLQSVVKRLEDSVTDKSQSHKIMLLSEEELKDFAVHIYSIDSTRTGTEMWDINEYIMTKYQSDIDTEFYNVVGLDTFVWMNKPDVSKHLNEGNLRQMHVVVFDRSIVLNGQQISGYESAKTLFKQNFEKVSVKLHNQSEISSTQARNCLHALQSITNFKSIPNVHNISAFKIFFKSKSEKAIIKRLKTLLSSEVMNVLNILDADIANIYNGNGNANLCLL